MDNIAVGLFWTVMTGAWVFISFCVGSYFMHAFKIPTDKSVVLKFVIGLSVILLVAILAYFLGGAVNAHK